MHGQMFGNELAVQIERLKRRLRRSATPQRQPQAETPRPSKPPRSVPQEQQPDAFVDTAAAFRALVEGIREGAAILALDRTVLTCNRRLAEMLKLECDQVKGQSMLEFIPPEDQPQFVALLQSAPEDFQRLRLRLSGGNTFPLPVELVITSLIVGGVRVYSLLATDMSRRRRAEEQLAFQAHLLANVSDAILAMDEHFRITHWNPAAERLYGWMAAEVLGRTASEVIHPELTPEQRRELNERLAQTGAFDNQSWHQRRDGAPIWVEARRIALRGPDGHMLGYVSVNRDMTERRRAEEALARQAALLDLTHDAIFVRDMQSVIVFWNRGAEELYGWTEEQALGQVSQVLLQTAFPKPRTEIEMEITRTGRWEGELVRKTRDDRRIAVSSRWALQRDAAGRPVAILETNNDVTERKRSEQALQALNAELEQRVVERTAELDAERARWQGVVEGIADEVWVCDAEGNMSLINLPAVTQMGLEEFKDKTVEEVYEEVDILNLDGRMRPPEQAPLLRSLKGEIVRGEEITRHRQTGRTRYRQFSSAPTRDSSGNITGAVAIVHDITEHKEMEHALRESEAKYRTLFTSVREGFTLNRALYDESGKLMDFLVLEANPAAEIANGLKREEFVGKTWRELWPGAEQYWWDVCNKVILQGQQVIYENYASVHNRWYEVRQFPAGPDLMGSIFTDITERRRVEAEREQLLAENQRRRAELDTIVASIADGLVIYDAQGRITFTNAAAERMLGYSAADNLPTSAERMAIAKPESEDGEPLQSDQTPAARALRGETVRDVVLRLRRAEWVRVSAAPLYDRAGYVQGAVSILTNFTERKQAGERIGQLNRDLRQHAVELELANKELESFSYSVSHDLQTPLTSIVGLSQILLQEDAARFPAESRPYVQSIHDNAVAMEQLIQGLLTLSRTSRQPLQKRTVSQADLVRQVWEEFISARAGRRVKFVVSALPDAQADPLLLKQVWVNLLSNALKYSRRREVAHIEIGSYEKDGETIYFVKDDGVGFDPEHAEKLFGVFQRLHSEEEYEGTGVGLAIVARIVHRHGGRVWAEGRVDQGATFYFTLDPGALGDPQGPDSRV